MLDISLIILTGLSVVLIAFYKWSTSSFDRFAKNGVDHVKPIPFFGNFSEFIFKRKDFRTLIIEYSERFVHRKFFGLYQLRSPIFVINDAQLIKQICIKDFEHFMDHRMNVDPEVDRMFSRNLFSLLGDKWKKMRTTLSPAFTGSKMRMMFELVSGCGFDAANFLANEAKTEDRLVIEMKDLFTRYTNDVIATAAFGIKVDSLANRENEFYLTGMKASKFDGVKALIFMLYTTIPSVMKFFNISLISKNVTNFFHSLVNDAMKYRERENIVRNDMINLLIQMKKGLLKNEEVDITNDEKNMKVSKFEDIDFTAQCFVFFLAGFDTSSTLLTFMSHELLINKEVQKRLITEVDEIRGELQGAILTYDALSKMKYMDMVISESLRKWAPTIITDRVCVKPYLLDDGEKKVKINVGDVLWLSITGIQLNSQNFSNPDKFDPERFSDENKGTIDPATFIPFGTGPRACIGSRFALMECKAIFYYLLSKFTFEMSEESCNILQLTKLDVTLKVEKGVWLRLKPRSVE